MSGGSYAYAYSEMEEGEISKAARYVDLAVEDIRELCAAEVVSYDTEEKISDAGTKYRIAHCRPATDEERIKTELALGALRTRIERFAETIATAQREARELAGVFKALEWRRSGDFGDSCVQEWAREWLDGQLGGGRATPSR